MSLRIHTTLWKNSVFVDLLEAFSGDVIDDVTPILIFFAEASGVQVGIVSVGDSISNGYIF